MNEKVIDKNAEKQKFIVYVRQALERIGLSCFPDGRVFPGELILKLKDEALVSRDNRVKFRSEKLNKISRDYGLDSMDRLYKESSDETLKGLYRLTFKHKDLDAVKMLKEYEADESCVFAAPNFMINRLGEASVPKVLDKNRRF